MFYLKSTGPVIAHLGLRRKDLFAPTDTTSILGNWYVNHFPVERRHAFIFMSERTLLSFILLEGRKADATKLFGSFIAGLSQLLELESFSPEHIDRVIDSYNEGAISPTTSASEIGSLNSLIQDYLHRIRHRGGLSQCDIGSIIQAVNRGPCRRLGWANALERTSEVVSSVIA